MSHETMTLKQAAEHIHIDQNELKHAAQRGEIEACERGGGKTDGDRSDLARTETEGHAVGKQRGDDGARGDDHGDAARPRQRRTDVLAHGWPCGPQHRVR